MRFAALLLALAVSGCASRGAQDAAQTLSFALMGDTPYSAAEIAMLDAFVDDMNRENLAFVVHVGDIKGGRGSCRDEVFQARKRQFERLRHAFVLLPGDNDWTDCHRAKEDPTEALVFKRFRQADVLQRRARNAAASSSSLMSFIGGRLDTISRP